jgi:hypothetical protein
MKKPLAKRRTLRTKVKPRATVEPSRLAIAALERIRSVMTKSGKVDRLGPPATENELDAQASLLGKGKSLPPSYAAALREHSRIGEPDILLTAMEIAGKSADLVSRLGSEAIRYLPFCESRDTLFCFDKGGSKAADPKRVELPVVEYTDGAMKLFCHSFAEWLDLVADAREESVENAASMPPGLKRLLAELGFRFEYPVVGRMETGDIPAVVELIGPATARQVRGDKDRLFDSSGKASLTLNVDEFTLAVSLRTGIFVFEAEDVFRWLRYFRDENFFGSDLGREPLHPDNVRDLTRAAAEPPLVLRGTMELPSLAARKHKFFAASGASASDFYLLARTASTSERAPSVILHLRDGIVESAHQLDEPLNDLYVSPTGSMWGLAQSHAVRFADGKARTYPLARPSVGRTWWYGIGGGDERIFVWGSGALLEFEGDRFVPFRPDASLDDSESVVSLSASQGHVSMLVCGDHMGAVATFDGKDWLPIGEESVLDGQLVDMDVWRGIALVLDKKGDVHRVERGTHRKVPINRAAHAFTTESGVPRPFHAIRGYDGGTLLASDGGVISLGAGEPVFHAAKDGRERTRLFRVGGRNLQLASKVSRAHSDDIADTGIIATSGPNVWLFRDGNFHVLDMHEW